jgi:hypothetical protein
VTKKAILARLFLAVQALPVTAMLSGCCSLTPSGQIGSVTEATLFGNKTDPLLLQTKTNGGSVIEYFGEKDDRGLTTSITTVRVRRCGRMEEQYFCVELRRQSQEEK